MKSEVTFSEKFSTVVVTLQAPEINWVSVMESLDQKDFYLRDQKDFYLPDHKSFSILMSIYGKTCQVDMLIYGKTCQVDM